MDPDPGFLEQPDYFRIFIQDFHCIDTCGSCEHLKLNRKTGFFRIFYSEVPDPLLLRSLVAKDPKKILFWD